MFRPVSWIFGLLVRFLFYVLFFGTPFIGIWLVSSLAAFFGGPHWIPWIAGLLMFPVIPGIWELHAWSHRRSTSKPWFTPLDRLSLRTFGVGLAFLALMLCVWPQAAFVALSTRGDWMLDGVKDSRAERIRPILFKAAGGLEWLYRLTKTNPYKAHVDSKARQHAEEATKQRSQEVAQQAQEQGTLTGDSAGHDVAHTDKQGAKDSDQQGAKEANEQHATKPNQQDQQSSPVQREKQATELTNPALKWPWKKAMLHPAVSNMPASVETSIESVARYIAAHETDPTLRIKALHDYVADRISYDSDAFYSGSIPDQSAQIVFRTRKSVCAGYANLLSSLADAVGEEIVVVTGDARDPATGDKLTGYGHAWNAARIGSHWYLIDACWDAGYVSREKGFTKSYRLNYFLLPPEVMVQDHFPDDQNWQLLATPLSQGEFLRQPMLTPSFQAAGLKLIAPHRACVDAGSQAMVTLKNPTHQWLMAGLERNGQRLGASTDPTDTETAQLICPLPDKGRYRLNMFINQHQQQYGQYEFVGSVDFVNR